MLAAETLLTVVLPLLMGVAVLGAILAVRRLHRPRTPWAERARDRFVMGVPWGSLLVIAFVLAVYLFVQDGLTDFSNPVTIPYRAYSYFYPLGMLTAPFSHAGPGHLVGNLAGTAVVAPIAEYAWGHYPDDTDDDTRSWWSDPRVRATVVFPLAVVGIGLLTGLFALGPVIGFSGVVFAFAAFALVRYPIVTLVGVLGVQGALVTFYGALRTPIGVYVAQPRPPSAPGWAGIAIQGHALGFFIGLVLGIALLRRRGIRPDAFRLWLAVFLVAIAQGLWQIYWFAGENAYVLFQGPGLLLVTVLSVVITAAVVGSTRSIVPSRLRRLIGDRLEPSTPAERPLERARRAAGRGGDRLERVGDLATAPAVDRSARVSVRRTSLALVLVVLAVVAGMAIPVNFFVLADDGTQSEAAVEIEDYTVQYAEGIENELASPIQVGPLAEAVSIESSGVIVSSEQRQLWVEAVSAQRLAYDGDAEVAVGGPGWREAVHVDRTGWVPVGNETVYQVEVTPEGGEPRLAHESNESRAEVRIDDRTITVDSTDGEFRIVVASTATGDVESTALPDADESTTADEITFERENDTIYAVSDGTRVAVADRETYL